MATMMLVLEVVQLAALAMLSVAIINLLRNGK